MSQVPLINNETLKTPEPSNVQRGADDFSDLLEKEKIKTLFPPVLPPNLQSFFNAPLSPGSGTEKAAGRVESFFAASNDVRRNSSEPAVSDDAREVKEQRKEQAARTAEAQKETKAEQARFTANAVNKIFGGELEISPDLYNAVIGAKNRTASLRSVDVDDLISQIKDRIKFLGENGKIELSIELKPENLGTILMNVSSSRGVLSINIFADQAAKQALEENIAELERSLKQADLYVDDLKIFSDGGRKHNKGETG